MRGFKYTCINRDQPQREAVTLHFFNVFFTSWTMENRGSCDARAIVARLIQGTADRAMLVQTSHERCPIVVRCSCNPREPRCSSNRRPIVVRSSSDRRAIPGNRGSCDCRASVVRASCKPRESCKPQGTAGPAIVVRASCKPQGTAGPAMLVRSITGRPFFILNNSLLFKL